MFERIHLQTIKKRINEPRKFIQVILGPRQVGKTTMMTQLLSQINIPYTFESADSNIRNQLNLAITSLGNSPIANEGQ